MVKHLCRSECIEEMQALLLQRLRDAGYKQPHVDALWWDGIRVGGNAWCGERRGEDKHQFGNERLGDLTHCSFSAPLGTPPHSEEAHKKECGWPMVWKVVKDAGMDTSCGNGCNMQFSLPLVCTICEQTVSDRRQFRTGKTW